MKQAIFEYLDLRLTENDEERGRMLLCRKRDTRHSGMIAAIRLAFGKNDEEARLIYDEWVSSSVVVSMYLDL